MGTGFNVWEDTGVEVSEAIEVGAATAKRAALRAMDDTFMIVSFVEY
jgi:hypothetical protein